MRWYQIDVIIYSPVFILSFFVKTFGQRKRTGYDPSRFNKSSSTQQRFWEIYGNFLSLAWLFSILGYSINHSFMEKTGLPLFFDFPDIKFNIAVH